MRREPLPRSRAAVSDCRSFRPSSNVTAARSRHRTHRTEAPFSRSESRDCPSRRQTNIEPDSLPSPYSHRRRIRLKPVLADFDAVGTFRQLDHELLLTFRSGPDFAVHKDGGIRGPHAQQQRSVRGAFASGRWWSRPWPLLLTAVRRLRTLA